MVINKDVVHLILRNYLIIIIILQIALIANCRLWEALICILCRTIINEKIIFILKDSGGYVSLISFFPSFLCAGLMEMGE